MNTSDINNILKRRCGKVFLGVFARDRLPSRLPSRRPIVLICNDEPHNKSGRHWLAMAFDENSKGEYFDSLGEEPEAIFKAYLNKYCVSWKRNNAQIQSVSSRFCGHYCIFYCLFKCLGYGIGEISKCFTSDTGLNDFMVHKFVCDNL